MKIKVKGKITNVASVSKEVLYTMLKEKSTRPKDANKIRNFLRMG